MTFLVNQLIYSTLHSPQVFFQLYYRKPRFSLYIKKSPNWTFQTIGLSKLDFSIIQQILEKLVYNRVYNFFTKNNYPLKFSFRQQYSTFHALISFTKDISKNLDKGNIDCDISVGLQKAFDIVEHDIFLAKLEHYGICGVANEWFISYLFDRKQFVSINGHVSNKTSTKYSVPQDSVLGLLLFLIYINDLNHATRFC